MRWRIAAVWLALTSGCAPADPATPPAPPIAAQRLRLPTGSTDEGATLDSLTAFTARVDADTARMPSIRRQLELGAGTTGLLTAWRSDAEWQRLHVAADGAGFSTRDTYWLHDGALVGARLEIHRPGQPVAFEHVWFRRGALFRWVDAAGRPLNPEARSTQSEVDMLRSRFDRIVQALPMANSEPR